MPRASIIFHAKSQLRAQSTKKQWLQCTVYNVMILLRTPERTAAAASSVGVPAAGHVLPRCAGVERTAAGGQGQA